MAPIKDSPGVYIPPPFLYAAIFLLSYPLQRLWPIDRSFFHSTTAVVLGAVCILLGLVTDLPALRQFFKTGNTLVTIKPARSLVTTGIYSVSRNPMYLSLLLMYLGLAFLVGNWWTLILAPILALIVNYYIIRREERYLERTFGMEYTDYKHRVRRWL